MKTALKVIKFFVFFKDILRYNSKELFVELSTVENKMERIFEYRSLIVVLLIDRSYYKDFECALYLNEILKKIQEIKRK